MIRVILCKLSSLILVPIRLCERSLGVSSKGWRSLCPMESRNYAFC
ncbi:hypothetical protein LINPERHAP1_LOCUS31392 [Linum perenne]